MRGLDLLGAVGAKLRIREQANRETACLPPDRLGFACSREERWLLAFERVPTDGGRLHRLVAVATAGGAEREIAPAGSCIGAVWLPVLMRG